MEYEISHVTRYSYSDVVPICHNISYLAPRDSSRQTCRSFNMVVQPQPTNIEDRIDCFGNRVAHFSIEQPHRGLTVTAKSRVETREGLVTATSQSTGWDHLAGELRTSANPEYLQASQFCFESTFIDDWSELADYAQASFPSGRPILEAALDLNHRIHTDFAYDPEATTIHTPLRDVFHHRRGVCQDFAHFGIACFRAMGLSARYVSGYLRTVPPPGKEKLVGADASHAWVSVFCGDLGWVDIDPTNDVLVSTDHVSVAVGRDYYDVCPIKGVIVGGGQHRMTVAVDVTPVP